MAIVIRLILLLITVYQVILFLRVMLTWFRIDPYTNPFARVLYLLTEPLLEPIRAILPSTGMIDFSPLVAFLVLAVIERVLFTLVR